MWSNVLDAVCCPHEGHHTGDQWGADHVQLSLKTNGHDQATARSLHPVSSPLRPPSLPPSLRPHPTSVFTWLSTLEKTFWVLFYSCIDLVRQLVWLRVMTTYWRYVGGRWSVYEGTVQYVKGFTWYLSLFLYFINFFKLLTTIWHFFFLQSWVNFWRTLMENQIYRIIEHNPPSKRNNYNFKWCFFPLKTNKGSSPNTFLCWVFMLHVFRFVFKLTHYCGTFKYSSHIHREAKSILTPTPIFFRASSLGSQLIIHLFWLVYAAYLFCLR